MSKPVLGRGLDRLMPAPSQGSESTIVSGTPPPVAPGLRILIRGVDELRPEAPEPVSPPAPQPQHALATVLFAADAVLVVWPAAWIFTNAQSGWLVLLASTASVALGAVCGLFALKAWRGL